ncbi:hypothetical protein B566_EDAN010758 [Ephemera danica]|nr:hypothetical protein B566_EDAN010758 [Ephemera danica]
MLEVGDRNCCDIGSRVHFEVDQVAAYLYLRTPLAIERMIGDGADDIIFTIFEDSFLTAHPLEDLGEGQFLVAAEIGSQLAVTHAMAELVTKLFVLDVAVVTLVGKGEHGTDKLFIGLTVLLTTVEKLGSLCYDVGPRSKIIVQQRKEGLKCCDSMFWSRELVNVATI